MDGATPIRVADPPFDDTNADLILISSDGIIFYVHKLLLALVSTAFETTFSLTQSQERYDGRPYVSLDDEARKLYLLLSWCDQRCAHRSTDLDDLQCVLELADKYSMDHIVAHVENTMLGMKDAIVSEPLRTFCIAARFRLRPVAHAAAIESLKVPVVEWMVPIPEMNHITASMFARLLQYHKTCVDEVQKLVNAVWKIWDGLVLTRSMDCGHCGAVYVDGRTCKTGTRIT
jgi:hypothetical protein